MVSPSGYCSRVCSNPPEGGRGVKLVSPPFPVCNKMASQCPGSLSNSLVAVQVLSSLPSSPCSTWLQGRTAGRLRLEATAGALAGVVSGSLNALMHGLTNYQRVRPLSTPF